MYRHNRQLLDQQVDEVLALVRARFGDDAELVARFARRFYADVIAQDFEGESTENLYGRIASLWQFFRQREGSGPKIRAYNPDLEQHGWQSTHTTVEIINDDMPFLVDSVVAALNALNLSVLMLIHPIIHVGRENGLASRVRIDATDASDWPGAESVLHVEVTQQPPGERHAEIATRLHQVLASVRAAVEDWRAMTAELDGQIAELKAVPPVAEDDFAEGLDFLEWLRDAQFTFLGHREYAFERRDNQVYARIVEDRNLGILREVSEESRARHAAPLPDRFASYLERKELFITSKAWTRSEVHRPVYMDYIGVRRFDANGRVAGERRFLGLLTSAAYSARPEQIPLLRRKVATVIERSGFPPGSHNAKALEHILDTLPRDELFQIDVDQLEEFAHGILHLEHRQRVRLFLRRDSYGQFVSCLVFIPREHYSTDLRRRMETILLRELQGKSVDVQTQGSDAPMARAHFIVHTPDGEAAASDPQTIEKLLVQASYSWDDEFREALADEYGEGRGMALHRRYAAAIPTNYKERSARAWRSRTSSAWRRWARTASP